MAVKWEYHSAGASRSSQYLNSISDVCVFEEGGVSNHRFTKLHSFSQEVIAYEKWYAKVAKVKTATLGPIFYEASPEKFVGSFRDW